MGKNNLQYKACSIIYWNSQTQVIMPETEYSAKWKKITLQCKAVQTGNTSVNLEACFLKTRIS